MSEQLWVKYLCDGCGDSGFHVREATDAEKLAAAATLDGAKTVDVVRSMNLVGVDGVRGGPVFTEPGRYLVIPLPDKETTE